MISASCPRLLFLRAGSVILDLMLGYYYELFRSVIVQVGGQLQLGMSALQCGDSLPVAWGVTDVHEIRLLFIK
ncbi:hypothetical protein [Pelobacter propionicus]|uniref:hypothetical protein n=1 Tax=Pelobacter propionicus TaxID=29543 RepID=UPI000323829C|nr:hypothetical protein [Pelobacter propionicus]